MCDSCGEHEPSHDHDHAHGHGHAAAPEAAPGDLRLEFNGVAARVLSANEGAARRVRRNLSTRGIVMVNVTGGPGCGKTALMRATLAALEPGSVAALVGDLETDRDAARLRGLGGQVQQINTGKGCHLTAAQVEAALDRLDLEGVETVLVENVGNMACPAEYDLGEHARVAVLSLPEGDDKVAKYPGLFACADAVVLNKVDLEKALPFDENVFRADLAALNTRAPVLRLSALGGQGLDAWMDWLNRQGLRLREG